jgi:hypothetical protein
LYEILGGLLLGAFGAYSWRRAGKLVRSERELFDKRANLGSYWSLRYRSLQFGAGFLVFLGFATIVAGIQSLM